MRHTLTLCAVVTLILGCGGSSTEQKSTQPPVAAEVKPPPPPDAASTAAMVAGSAEFSEFEFTNAGYSLPLKESAMNAPARAVAKELVAAKWITIKGDDVVLGSKATSDRRWLVRPNGFVDIVPLAKKEFVAVTAIEPQSDGTVAATFSWRWLPNDIGQAFHQSELKARYDGERRASANLMWDGTNWTVLRITKLP